MAGSNDEDETMLQEIIGELGGDSGMSIKQLFLKTLEQLKKFKEDHHDLNKKIDDMKQAMDKDLSNPKTLEIIT